MKINPLYKRVLALAVVLGPAYWLIITEDGQRRSDAFMLQLFGREVIDFNLAELNQGVTRADLTETVFPEVPWQCRARPTELGDSLCTAELGAFNGIPARLITLYFVGDQVNAMKLVYRERYHNQMVSRLRQHLGTPVAEAEATSGAAAPPAPSDGVVQWRTEHGVVLAREELSADEPAALMWLAAPSTTSKMARQE